MLEVFQTGALDCRLGAIHKVISAGSVGVQVDEPRRDILATHIKDKAVCGNRFCQAGDSAVLYD